LRFEFPILILLATLGMIMMVSAGGLISLYMGLELQSLSLYVVAAFNRESPRSTEAGLKYFVLGALSSGLLLYGASLIYGYTGSTRFEVIAQVIEAEGASLGLTFGLVFLCTALAFKISAAPFHMWTPDVYEGSPTPVTFLFATAPKVAAGGLFARVLFDGFGHAVAEWQQVLVDGLFLDRPYGVCPGRPGRGHRGRGAVAADVSGDLCGDESRRLRLYPVDGARRQPAVLMFSLAGLPPMVGFFAKFFVFKAAVDAGLAPLAIAGAVASVIGAYYYMNIVRVMYLAEPGQPLELRLNLLQTATIGVSALIMGVGWLPFLGGLGVPEMALGAAQALLR
jgi:NADH-quinone oxidoreductase subunit N